ncbi:MULTISPECIES: hypothetical protein [Thalassospira]|jgi:hypothetical protein|uniref:Uncharacterized protein n=1 Tax=Thalassospira povalilytica TaxID=732237 RepID=A0A8I1SHH7_9PROT|nr:MULTISPECIES: hypothetical protein [Thalassospira]MEE3045278.1 hypothetical protein [Pseudomonadota bacterium]RCK28345.1 hypothetical protein TH8_03010 [Thalassospira profundimaris]MAL40581.1 hypothetical protein [Thalassospira sp.]MBN8194994.1 hypothetical protein [Thalassospira povalilytica]MBO6770656.1 hypothetical protein [Thalassospira sp.]|tara:strand:+ start:632 stop:814 length:183 start_codon:yes stop_codon:yes gene_type:complete
MATYEEITTRYISTTEIEAGVRKGQQLRAEFVGSFFRNLFKGSDKASDIKHPAGTVGGAA